MSRGSGVRRVFQVKEVEKMCSNDGSKKISHACPLAPFYPPFFYVGAKK